MTSRWYIVKRNWAKTAERAPGYAGLGGDVWPLDSAVDQAARAAHTSLMKSRAHGAIGDREEFLCTEIAIAEQYWAATETLYGNAWLLELSIANSSTGACDGIDLGFPAGGFSVVETELIIQELASPGLNQWALFDGLETALAYSKLRSENERLEQLDSITAVAIAVLRKG